MHAESHHDLLCNASHHRYNNGWNIQDVAMFFTFNLNHAKASVKDVELELLEEYRKALISSPGFPEAEAAAMTSEAVLNEYVSLIP